MEIPNFEGFLPQEGYKIRTDDVEGIDLFDDVDNTDELGNNDESPPDFTAHLFRSNDFNISFMESEPGGDSSSLPSSSVLSTSSNRSIPSTSSVRIL